MVTLGILAVSLAVDAAAVSASLGATGASWARLGQAAVLFGLFQGGMAAAGALGGLALAQLGGPWPHLLGAGLLAWVGGRMLVAAPESEVDADVRLPALLGLAVATSIDALVAGVTLPTQPVPVVTATVAIGGVTVALSLVGAAAGRWFEAHVGPLAVRLAGLVLVGLALQMLVTGLTGAR